MIEDFKSRLENFKEKNNIVGGRISKQQEILTPFKEELLELKKEKLTYKIIIQFIEEELGIEKGIIKESSLKTFYKNYEKDLEETKENENI
jgi:hypothetical protein